MLFKKSTKLLIFIEKEHQSLPLTTSDENPNVEIEKIRRNS